MNPSTSLPEAEPANDIPFIDSMLASDVAITPALLSPSPEFSSRKQWQAGTLTYTPRGLIRLFCWMLWGDFALQIKERSVTDVVRLLLSKFHATNAMTALLMITVPSVMAWIAHPIISYKSDRHRGRFGRRRPFLMVGTPIAAAAIIGMALAPAAARWFHQTTTGSRFPFDKTALFCFGFAWMIFEAANILAGTVYHAFVNDVVPRPVLAKFYAFARFFSLVAGIFFMGWLFGKASDHYVAIFVGVGLLYGIGCMGSIFVVKEGEYPPVPVRSDHSSLRAARTYLRDCFGKPYYCWIFAALILPPMAFQPIYTFNLFFSQSVGMTGDRYGKLTAMYFTLSLVQTLPLGWLADKFHPLRLVMVALSLHLIVALCGGLFIHDTRSFGIAFVLTGMLQGTWYTSSAALAPLLFSKPKFAQYISAMSMIAIPCGMVFTPLVGKLLDLTGSVYRYTYLLGGIIDIAALVATFVVFRKFLAFGGTKNYAAPE
jgi:MFS family permease